MAFKKTFHKSSKEVTSNISNQHYEIILKLSKEYKLPMSRLIGIAIENEIFNEEKPFQVDLSFPEDYIENAYASEAGKIINYLKTIRDGMTLDLLYILRHDIGIPDKDRFLAGMKECLNQKQLEAYVAAKTIKYQYTSDDVIKYRVNSNNPVIKKKVMKKVSRYEQYQKLKKEFGHEE